MNKKDHEKAVKDSFSKGKADQDWATRPNKGTWTDDVVSRDKEK